MNGIRLQKVLLIGGPHDGLTIPVDKHSVDAGGVINVWTYDQGRWSVYGVVDFDEPVWRAEFYPSN